MANEIRVRVNNISGTLSSAITAGQTSITASTFTQLPTIDTTNHLILILDPLEISGEAEIVRVTSHAAASATATVVRGAENTTPRDHPLGTTWFHGPVVSDWTHIVTSGTRSSVPYEGEFIYETDTNKFVGFGGVDWAPRDAGGQLGYAENTAGDQALSGGTETLLTGLSVTCTVGTGRRIKITAKGSYFAAGVDAANAVRTRIKQDTVNITGGAYDQGGMSNQFAETYQFSVIFSPFAGSHTYTVSGQRVNGAQAVSHRANTSENAFLLVEDIGAA